MNIVYDIAIIGGGLVGASLAAALRHTNLNIALLEAGTWSPPDSILPQTYDERVLALNYASYRILNTLGVWEKVHKLATPIQHIHVSDQGHFGKARLHCAELQVPALGYVLGARPLGQALQQTLQNIQVYSNIYVQTLSQQTEYAELACLQANTEKILRSRLVVIADGSDSGLRQKLGVVTQTQNYAQTAIIANVTVAYPHNYTAYERFTAQGPFALLPLSGNCCSLVWTVAPDKVTDILALSDRDFLSALQKEFGWRLGTFTQVGVRHAYPLRLVRALNTIGSRYVVIGNAAHTLHPIAGQGFNLGLRDVATLCEVIMQAHQQQEDLGALETLARYAKIQQPDQARIAFITDSLVNVFSNELPILRNLRGLGLSVLQCCPPLKRQFMKQMMGLNTHPNHLLSGIAFSHSPQSP